MRTTMEKPKHSTGPWRNVGGYLMIGDDNEGKVVYYPLSGHPGAAENHANVDLMAAAPKMAALLRRLRDDREDGASTAEIQAVLDAADGKTEPRSPRVWVIELGESWPPFEHGPTPFETRQLGDVMVAAKTGTPISTYWEVWQLRSVATAAGEGMKLNKGMFLLAEFADKQDAEKWANELLARWVGGAR